MCTLVLTPSAITSQYTPPKKRAKIVTWLSNIKNDIPSNKKKVIRSIHRQEANFHNSIKTFTIRVTLIVKQNCMVIKIVYCLEPTSRTWTPCSHLDGTQRDMYIYITKFINIKRFIPYAYRTNCTSTIKIIRTATQHNANRMIHDNANFHYGTPHRWYVYHYKHCSQNGRSSKMKLTAFRMVEAATRGIIHLTDTCCHR